MDVLTLIDPGWQKDEYDYHLIQPGDQFPNLIGGSLAVDTETMPTKHIKKAALSPFHNAPFGVGIACAETRQAYYFPLRHRAPGDARRNLDIANVQAYLRETLAGARLIMNGNWKYDCKTLDQDNVPAKGHDHVPFYDPIIGATLIDERIPVNMQYQSHLHLGMEETKKDELEPYIVGNKDFQDWSYIPADLMATHTCGDVERAIRLSAAQRALLRSEEVEELAELEMRVCRDLIHMELRGHRVDVPLMQQDLPKLIVHELAVAKRIEQLVGVAVNYESPKDLAEMFVTRLGLPIISHKPGKDRKTGADVMNPVFDGAVMQTYQRLYPQHSELMFRIRQARRLGDMKAFVQQYLEATVKGAIHTTIKQVEARTGRESSEMPNLQNISGEDEWDVPLGMEEMPMLRERIRTQKNGNVVWVSPGCDQYFIAREGHTILSLDYSQVEYRFFAHYLKDQRLLEKYRNDPTTDLHDWVAKEILHGKISRDDAKSANFGIVFGMGDKKLAKYMATQGIGITEAEANQALTDYYRAVPLEQLQDEVGRALIRRGFVRTILGRRRRVTKFRRQWGQARNKEKDRGLEAYQALNAICQGGAVDLLKHRSNAVRPMCVAAGGDIILKIHDDVKIEVPTERAEMLAAQVKPVLESFLKKDGTPYLSLPLTTKCTRTETSWYDARKMEVG